jgi:hypothetical protein
VTLPQWAIPLTGDQPELHDTEPATVAPPTDTFHDLDHAIATRPWLTPRRRRDFIEGWHAREAAR